MRRQSDPFFAWSREWFVSAVRVTRIGAVHVGKHQLRSCPGQIVLKLSCDQRASAGLGMQLEHLRALAGAEYISHSDRPNFPRNSGQRDVFDIQSAIQEEG